MSKTEDLTLLVSDQGGLYSYVAASLVSYFGKVQYHKPSYEPYLRSPQAQIGKGMPDVEWIDMKRIGKAKDKADIIFHPDVFDAYDAAWHYEKGFPIVSSGRGARMELDKIYFLEQLSAVGLPVPKTTEAIGLDDLWEKVKDAEPKSCYIKNSEAYRGDWETKQFRNKYAFAEYLNDKRAELGEERSKEIKLLIQKKIKSKCEIGVDTPGQLDGEIPDNSALGYEIKDEGVIEKVFEKMPKIVQDVNDKLAPTYKRLGYRAPYSLEMRITESGIAYPIDVTGRCGCPPTGAMLKMYGKSYAEALWSLAQGVLPTLKPEYRFGAEIILASAWYRRHTLHVGMSDDIKDNVMLKNSTRKAGQWFCVPNDPSGSDGVFGSIVAVSNKSWRDAADKVMEMVMELDVDQLDYRKDLFDEAEEQVAGGLSHGIDFS